ncbi:hypothetical protein BGU51_08560 [Clostridioides difficile]|nr:hypothetical protein QI7_2215 [Clostridioides difficile 6042]EQG41702.1 hypothetical protein QIU_2985 [Clostridioides difficile DA00132]EQI26078.1 hypothetical protein QOQ_2907 [Clostridioides difficile Y171]EQI56359.1 hypothetical protein QQ9_3021 [Clostridioides difficile Y312]PBF25352.1 hypothetical protein BGU42_03380 [Clostridioides difficile]
MVCDMDFSKFDKAIDVKGLKEDIKEASENSGKFKDVPHGTYEVEINKMELSESKKGDPMFVCWFKILEGEYKDSLIFMNQVVKQGFQIHIVNEFLRSLETDIEVEFESYSQYAQLIMDIAEEIDGELEFAIEYGEKKGFNTFTIKDIFEVA